MDEFLEKMDAMRMNLELAIHDIEAQRARFDAMGEKIEELRAGAQELRVASQSQYESIQALIKISGDLVRTAEIHEHRLNGIEGRI
jgi:hypothetical protein